MRVPTRQDARRQRRQALLDEQRAMLRVLQARVRRRYHDAAILLIERAESTWQRLRARWTPVNPDPRASRRSRSRTDRER